MKTGYLIEIYIDDNPMSPTYGETMEVKLYNTEECPTQGEPQWTEIYRYCEMLTTGAYTGYEITVLQDVNPDSATYGETVEERAQNTEWCPPDDNLPDWQSLGDGFCEQTAYMPSGKLGNDGYWVEQFMDVNEYSPTYQQIEQRRTSDLTHCPLPDTNPTWIIVSETCHLIDDGHGNMVFDGTKDIIRYDANEYSSSYNFGVPETINVRDTENCPVSSDYPIWTEQSYQCVLDSDGYRTGEITITEMDTNSLSPTYGQTRTRTVTGDPRCPVETPQSALTISWKIVNNRSGSTDLIQGITVTFNDGLTFTSGGGIPPVGGYREGTSQIPYSKRNTQFRVQSITLTPNTSAPTAFTWSQNPNPYIQASQPSTQVLITLMDDSGTNPTWVEQSRTCEHDSQGNNTGFALVVELDTNPSSSSYNTTRTRRERDTENCPVNTTPNWQQTSSECQVINGFNTGKRVTSSIDINPYSPTYNTTRTVITDDLENCPIVVEPNWVLQSRTCEKTSLGRNTGYVIDVEVDNNPNSISYNETRTNRYQNTSICQIEPEPTVTLKWRVINDRPSTTDTITRFFAVCNDGLTLDLNGNIAPGTTVNASQPIYSSWVDTPFTITNVTVTPNSSSPTTYGWLQEPVPFTWSTDGSDYLTVRLYDSSQAYWLEQSWYCEQQNGFNSGRTVIVEKDYNPTSQTYNTTRTRIVSDDERCVRDTAAAWTETSWYCEQDAPDTTPHWTIESWSCEQGDPTPNWVEQSRTCVISGGYNNGRADVTEIDTNPLSQTYNTTRTRTVEDLTTCPLNAPNWVETARVCVTSGGQNTGYASVTETDTNPNSSSYNTSRTSTVEDLTNCPLPPNPPTPPPASYKVYWTTTNGSDYVACNGSSQLTNIETTYSARPTFLTVSVGNCVTDIGRSALANCTNATSITISNTVTVIERSAFSGCSSVTTIAIPSGVTSIDDYTFYGCSGLTSMTIPSGVTSIGDSAFQGCSSLTSITIPSAVTWIDSSAFSDCTSLTSITCLTTTPPSNRGYMFENTNNCPIYVPAASVNAYQSASGWSAYASRIQGIS